MSANFLPIQVAFDDQVTHPHTMFIKRQTVKTEQLNNTLFVLNVPPYCGKIGLENIFKECGKIVSVRLREQPGPTDVAKPSTFILEYVNLKSHTFQVAYIEFDDSSSVDTALEISKKVVRHMSTSERPIVTGVEKWMREYRSRYPNPNVLQTCADQHMREYDERERLRKQAEEESVGPDDDGWTTVPMKNKNKIAGLPTKTKKSKKQEKRERQESELKNFYLFQQREAKRDKIADLRQKFEEDKKRIAQLRQQRKFKPF